MIHRLRAHLEVIRLGIRQRGLRRWEEAALVRLGQAALADGRAREGRLAALAADAAVARERLTPTWPPCRAG